MVTKERKLVSIEVVNTLLEKYQFSERNEVVDKLKKLPVRQPAPAPPEGGISIRAASRKYGIGVTTLFNWVRHGYIPILLRTKNETYIDERITSALVNGYKTAPGKGKWTIREVVKALNT